MNSNIVVTGSGGQLALISKFGEILWQKQDSGGYYRFQPHKKEVGIDNICINESNDIILTVNALGCITMHSQCNMMHC